MRKNKLYMCIYMCMRARTHTHTHIYIYMKNPEVGDGQGDLACCDSWG